MGWIFLGLFAAFFLFSFLWGLLRGVARTRIRIISIAVSFVMAILCTVFLKSLLAGPWSMENLVVPLLNSFEITILGDLLNMSQTLNEVLLGCVGAIAAPILFVICFIVCSLITWIIYQVVALCMHGTLRRQNQGLRLKAVRLLPYAAVSALLLVMVLMVPVSVYSDIAPTVTDELTEAGILEGETADTVNQVLDDYVKPLDESFSMKAFRTLGGNAICDLFTDFKVRDKTTNLNDEVGIVTDFGCNIYRLSKSEFTQYSSEEASVILAVADSFDRSELLPVIVGEVVYNAADSWLKGDKFLDIEKPDMGGLFNPFFDTVLRILQKDAQNTDALQADIRTLAELISTLANHQIFAHLSDPTALLTQLDSAGALDEIINCLGKNQSMKVLIPEITNLGIRAMADSLGIPADNLAIYEDLLDDIAQSLNNIKSVEGEAARTEAMTKELQKAFDNAGIDTDDTLFSCYSASMVSDMLNGNVDKEIQGADVRAFFALYNVNTGNATVSSGKSEENLAGTVEIPADVLEGTVYENMSPAELANTGAAVLANVTKALSEVTTEGDKTVQEQATNIIKEAYSTLLGAESTALEQLESIVIEAPLPQETLDFASNLSSADAVGDMSSRITVDKLVVNAQDFLDNNNVDFDIQAEGEVIRAVVSAAGTVLGTTDPENINIEDIASSAGKIMDALSESGVFGEEQTKVLFNAVLQSEQVREVAGLDMKTANQLAEKATETKPGEKVNYTSTMETVSSSVQIVTQMGNGEEIKEEDLVDMIKNITPASAGMIEVYVTADRLVGYGVPEAYAGNGSKMIADIFSYLAHAELTEEEFNVEAKALNQILSIAMASSKDTTGKKLFGEILPEEGECINILMSSKAIQHSLKNNLTDGEKVTVMDPFGLSEKLHNLNNYEEEKAILLGELDKYHQNHPETDPLVLEALAAMFGVEIDVK